MKRAAFLLVLLFPLALLAADAPSGATTVILVRHAEAEAATAEAPDPKLTEAGQARAKALLALARDAQVSAVFVTSYRRTKDTAADVVAALKVPVVETPIDRAKIAEGCEAIAKRILEEHRGQTVLVVGHSNTIPLIAKALSGVATTDIAHEEYGRVYIVVHEAGKPARVVVAKYGG